MGDVVFIAAKDVGRRPCLIFVDRWMREPHRDRWDFIWSQKIRDTKAIAPDLGFAWLKLILVGISEETTAKSMSLAKMRDRLIPREAPGPPPPAITPRARVGIDELFVNALNVQLGDPARTWVIDNVAIASTAPARMVFIRFRRAHRKAHRRMRWIGVIRSLTAAAAQIKLLKALALETQSQYLDGS